MRRILAIVFVLFVSFELSSYSFKADSSGFDFAKESYLFSYRYGRVAFKTPSFDIGDVTRRGFLRFIKSPYDAPLSLLPVAGKWRKSAVDAGAVLRINEASFFYIDNAAGVTLSLPYFDSAAIFSFREMKSDEFKDAIALSPAFYLFLMTDLPYVNVLLSSSISKSGRLSLFSALKAEACGYYADLRIGKLEQLFESGSDAIGSLELKTIKGIYTGTLFILLGEKALYSYEYQDRRIECVHKLSLNGLDLKFRSSSSIDRRGVVKSDNKIEAVYSGFSSSFSFNGKSSYRLRLGDAYLIFENGSYSVELKKIFQKGDWSLIAVISSKSGLSLALNMMH